MEFRLKRFSIAINVTRIANIHYFEFTNKYHTQRDKHAFREMVYVDNSSIFVDSEQYYGPLRKNQLIIHNPWEEHALSCPDEEPANVIIIGFECRSDELNRFASRPTTLSPELQRALTESIKEGRSVFLPPYDEPNLRDMKKRADYPFGADQMIKLGLETFLIRLIRSGDVSVAPAESPHFSSKIMEIHHYITENFRESINLDELCFLFNTNKTTLCSQFRQTFGLTVIDYVNKLKIKEARKLLREGKQNVTQIALGLGFSSLHYFSRTFKQYEGMSPSEYAKTIKSRLDG